MELFAASMEEYFGLLMGVLFLLFLPGLVITYFWISSSMLKSRLRRNGLDGPQPSFPLGNLMEMYKKVALLPPPTSTTSSSSEEEGCSIQISHDIHSTVFPYFARWRKIYGKAFIYWLGTEPFLYIEDPEILRKITSGKLGKKWGKPDVFKHDRKPMFGTGLVMIDGDNWARHRNIIAPAFSTTNLNKMIAMMEDSTTKMLQEWVNQVRKGANEIDVEKEITMNAAEIIAMTSFGISQEKGKEVFQKLQAMQIMLFKKNRLVGVPFSKFFSPMQSYKAWKLGKEIDELLFDIISSRKKEDRVQDDLLGLLLAGNEEEARDEKKLTRRELVDECKTFFFGGHETTGLALTWTLLLLALYPEWQKLLREEIMEVSEGRPLNSDMLPKLIKMGWVWNEVLRLYSPAPNSLRQAREEIVIDEITVEKGTNMWIDVVGMHHDKDLWGDDVNEFKPERFKDSINGGCKHRIGYLPFGFGGRICIGRNLSLMEYKIVLSLILCKFTMSISPAYVHSPRIMLSLRPSQGVPLILHPLE
ncbi:Cytochrome P450 714C2 [Dendrobium catenatum]|uniref:Cytochrome P450 714C2 n=1 Tax=Dendrobium catenatum TaxID=906689 RepID=A0A2I0VI06_9ASPA|nr:Cytochrome P450 714C2 [Dendrobium catenatum]